MKLGQCYARGLTRRCPLITMTGDQCSVCLESLADQGPCLACTVCKKSYHARCIQLTAQQCDTIQSFHCPDCTLQHGPSTCEWNRFKLQVAKIFIQIPAIDKQTIRKSDRQHTKLNYADMNEGLTGDEKIWEKIITSKQFAVDPFKRCKGDQVNIDLIRREGLNEPIVFPDPTGLDMAMPRHDITVRDIADLVGKSVVICAATLTCVLSLSLLF